ncbi:hypothetical protein ACJJTC_018342 [Scirpophaga incertulas]
MPVSSQPVCALDWTATSRGWPPAPPTTSTLRVLLTTKLNLPLASLPAPCGGAAGGRVRRLAAHARQLAARVRAGLEPRLPGAGRLRLLRPAPARAAHHQAQPALASLPAPCGGAAGGACGGCSACPSARSPCARWTGTATSRGWPPAPPTTSTCACCSPPSSTCTSQPACTLWWGCRGACGGCRRMPVSSQPVCALDWKPRLPGAGRLRLLRPAPARAAHHQAQPALASLPAPCGGAAGARAGRLRLLRPAPGACCSPPSSTCTSQPACTLWWGCRGACGGCSACPSARSPCARWTGTATSRGWPPAPPTTSTCACCSPPSSTCTSQPACTLWWGCRGRVRRLQRMPVSSQPVCALDWNRDFQGLAALRLLRPAPARAAHHQAQPALASLPAPCGGAAGARAAAAAHARQLAARVRAGLEPRLPGAGRLRLLRPAPARAAHHQAQPALASLPAPCGRMCVYSLSESAQLHM